MKHVSFALLLLVVLSCKKSDPQSDQKALLTFGFTKAANPSVSADASGLISGQQVTLMLPAGSNASGLKATFSASPLSNVTVNGARQESGVTANDFTRPVTYRVTAEDGSTADYTVSVTVAKSSEKNLTAFSFLKTANPDLANDVVLTLNGSQFSGTLPAGTKVTNLKASFSASPAATVTVNGVRQESGVTANDFSKPLTYTITAEDGSTQSYAVNLSVAAPPVPVANFSLSINRYTIPATLTINGDNSRDDVSIKINLVDKGQLVNTQTQSLTHSLTTSGLYVIEYSASNSSGTSKKVDSLIVFEGSALPSFYDVKLSGITVRVRERDVSKSSNQSKFLFLNERINRMEGQVPNWAYQLFTNTVIWIDDINKKDAAMWYHASEGYLIQIGEMREKVKGIEITNLTNFVAWTKGESPESILHENAHAYHDKVLTNGFENKMVLEAFDKSMKTQKYDLVDYIRGGKYKHYATSNVTEYFAELTESYFGTNDYFPFNREQLKTFDPIAFELMQKVWEQKIR